MLLSIFHVIQDYEVSVISYQQYRLKRLWIKQKQFGKLDIFLIKVMKTARQTGNLLEADDAFNSKSLGHEEILDVSNLQLTLIFIFPFYLFMYVTLFFISQHVFCNQPFYCLYRSCRISPGGLLFITPSICIF